MRGELVRNIGAFAKNQNRSLRDHAKSTELKVPTPTAEPRLFVEVIIKLERIHFLPFVVLPIPMPSKFTYIGTRASDLSMGSIGFPSRALNIEQLLYADNLLGHHY